MSRILALESSVQDWWAVNRAIYRCESNSVYMGCISYSGEAVFGAYNLSTRSSNRTVVAQLGVDEHNTPAILVEVDKPPIIAYTNHNKDNYVRVRRGNTIYDVADFNEEQTVVAPSTVTYIQMHREAATDNLYIFTRVGGFSWYCVRSMDFGSAWIEPFSIFFLGQKMYIVTSKDDNDVLHVALYGHPTSSSIHDVYFCTIDFVSGDIATTDGTIVGNIKTGANLPIDVTTTLTKAYTCPSGHNTRLFDINQNDEIVIADWTTDNDAVYKYLSRDGNTWNVSSLVAAGTVIGYTPAIHYHAGASLAFNGDVGTVFVAREDSGTWYLEKWVTADGGSSWTTTLIDSSTELKLARPWQAINSSGFIYVGFTSYTDYTHYVGDIYWYNKKQNNLMMQFVG